MPVEIGDYWDDMMGKQLQHSNNQHFLCRVQQSTPLRLHTMCAAAVCHFASAYACASVPAGTHFHSFVKNDDKSSTRNTLRNWDPRGADSTPTKPKEPTPRPTLQSNGGGSPLLRILPHRSTNQSQRPCPGLSFSYSITVTP